VELELRNLLRDELGFDVERNLDQTRGGGFDLIGVPGFGIEVKARKSWPAEGEIAQMWEQAVSQAKAAQTSPMLALKVNHRPWKFRLFWHEPELPSCEIWTTLEGVLWFIRESQ